MTDWPFCVAFFLLVEELLRKQEGFDRTVVFVFVAGLDHVIDSVRWQNQKRWRPRAFARSGHGVLTHFTRPRTDAELGRGCMLHAPSL